LNTFNISSADRDKRGPPEALGITVPTFVAIASTVRNRALAIVKFKKKQTAIPPSSILRN